MPTSNAMMVANNQGASSVSGTCNSGTACLTYTFTLSNANAGINQAAVAPSGGWQDPTNAFHPANSWYLGGLTGALFGTGHLVDWSPVQNLNAHIDPFGPLNPLHYLVQLPLERFSGAPQPVTCNAVGGCTFGP